MPDVNKLKSNPLLKGFLSDHVSKKKVVRITAEPETIYFEEARNSINLNFDFVISGLTDKKLIIRFIKVAIYDEDDNLITFRHLNHNAVGTSGIQTIGKYEINGRETFDIFNPFFSFPKDFDIKYLRYMFTFYEPESKQEFYYGNIIVNPVFYKQKVKLSLPVKGLVTILDGHDYYSHHRRFSMSIVRDFTQGIFQSNFSRYGLDFTLLGSDGNTRDMTANQFKTNYDFHFDDIKKFYTHEADIYSPADGIVVDIVNQLEDLYDTPFNMKDAVKENRIQEIAGNYIIIQHNEFEYSHLYHLLKGSIEVKIGQKVKQGQKLAKIGFSGASTVYSHLHYQLMDGKDFLNDNSLPAKFSNIEILCGSKKINYGEISLDTGDFIISD